MPLEEWGFGLVPNLQDLVTLPPLSWSEMSLQTKTCSYILTQTNQEIINDQKSSSKYPFLERFKKEKHWTVSYKLGLLPWGNKQQVKF